MNSHLLKQQLASFMDRGLARGQPETFLRPGVLEVVLTQTTIYAVLGDIEGISEPQRRRKAMDILQEQQPATKVLAILIWIDRVSETLTYLEHVNDNELPKHDLPNGLPGGQDFMEAQWKFLVPLLDRSLGAEFEMECILPFQHEAQNQAPRSGYGKVEKICVDGAHQIFDRWRSKNESIILARKILAPDAEYNIERVAEDYRRERRVLKLLNQRGHSSIIELLSCFQHGDEFSFIFPWAHMNLAQLLVLAPNERPLPLQDSKRIYRAMQGIADALDCIDELVIRNPSGENDEEIIYHGYHHDIKPDNILVRGKMFMIADFGWAKLHPKDDIVNNKQRLHQWTNGGEEYAPPEVDPEHRQKEIDCFAVDLWAFGCILLEVLVYTCLNVSGLQDFREARRTFHGRSTDRCFHRLFALKDVVESYFDSLREITKTAASLRLEAGLIDIARGLMNPRDPFARRNLGASSMICKILDDYLESDDLMKRPEQESQFRSHLTDGNLLQRDSFGRNSLHQILRSNSVEAVQSVLERAHSEGLEQTVTSMRDYLGDTPLHIAAQRGDHILFSQIMTVSSTAYHGSCHSDASDDDKLDIEHPLLKQNNLGSNALHIVAEHGADTIVQIIVDTLITTSAAQIAQEQQDVFNDTLFERVLLADDIKGRIPLHYAAQMPYSNAWKIMLEAGHPNQRRRMLLKADDNGLTPLHAADSVGFSGVNRFYRSLEAG